MKLIEVGNYAADRETTLEAVTKIVTAAQAKKIAKLAPGEAITLTLKAKGYGEQTKTYRRPEMTKDEQETASLLAQWKASRNA